MFILFEMSREKTPIENLQADEHRFAIILGAGAAGIIQGCTFIREKTLPLEEFQILERQSAFGGVWWKNTYPGAACDIPSHEYQISFALNPCQYSIFKYVTVSLTKEDDGLNLFDQPL